MKAFLQITAVILVSLFSFHVHAEGVIVYGGGFSFLIKAPGEWAIDTTSGALQGLNVILHPEGGTNLASFIYGRVLPRKTGEKLETLISHNDRDFLSSCPGGKIRPRADIKVIGGNYAKTKDYTCPGRSAETVSFIDCEGGVVLFVLHAGTTGEHDRYIKDFESVARSFVWMGSKVVE